MEQQDYYSFGMPMPGRSLSLSNYKFGFNGKENDNEVKGLGNWQDYGMRYYDTRLARFPSVDPLFRKYPELTTFQFSSNNPIYNIDLDGLEGIPAQQEQNGLYTMAQSTLYESAYQAKINVVNNPNPSGVIYQRQPTLADNAHDLVNSPSSNFVEATAKFAGRITYSTFDDAYKYGTGLIYGRSSASDMRGYGVSPSEYLDAGIGTLLNAFPVEKVGKATVGEFKYSYSEYASQLSKQIPTSMKKAAYATDAQAANGAKATVTASSAAPAATSTIAQGAKETKEKTVQPKAKPSARPSTSINKSDN